MPVIEELAAQAQTLGTKWLLIGAAARDLTVHAPLGNRPTRQTHDIDIAVAVQGTPHFQEFTSGFERIPNLDHKVRVLGVEVDVVPFGGLEEAGTVTFTDESRLDVVGLAEALEAPDIAQLAAHLAVPVASAEAQTALKILAWRDRGREDPKDARDLRTLLEAASDGVYGDETWDDEHALRACDHDHPLAAAFRSGRLAGGLFTDPARAAAVTQVLCQEATRRRLDIDFGRPRASAPDLLDAYTRGFNEGRPY
ncbi:nucleotidyl transferase AbiEii/AbiGii toxin family protein [Mariniluteicoccus flavus]